MAEKKEKEPLNLDQKAEEILKVAESYNVDKNFFFITSFRRYTVQIKILEELEKTLKEDGVLVTKQYVKGRENVYTHPAIQDFNRTTDSANKTVATLLKIIRNFNSDETDKNDDPLSKLINGDDDIDGSGIRSETCHQTDPSGRKTFRS